MMASLDKDLTLLIRECICKPLCCRKINRCVKICTKARREAGIAMESYIVARPDFGIARIVKDEKRSGLWNNG